MPAPANDNFANATVLASAGTLTGDNTDATSDGANDPLVGDGYGVCTVWYQLDATTSGFLTIGTTSGGGSPIGDSVIGVYQGTTLAGLTMLDVDDDGGPGNYSQITDLAVSSGDPIYIEVTGYDDGTFGTFTLTWSFSQCFDAVDIINPDSPTASVVSGRVRETWPGFNNPYNVHEKTMKFTWAGAAGAYKLRVTARPSATPGALQSRRLYVLASVNGRALIMTPNPGLFSTDPPASNQVTFYAYNGLDDGATIGVYDASGDYSNFPWVILSPGDVVELMVISDVKDASDDFIPSDIEEVCFIPDPSAPATLYCTGAVAFEANPIGDTWGDDLGYGGQRLVPDQIYAHLGYTIDSHGPSDFAWGINFVDYDMVALPNGVVYVAIKEGYTDAFFANGEAYYTFLVVKKYNPGTDTWTQIATLNFFDPITGAGHTGGCAAGPHFVDTVNAYYDPIGDRVYFAWMEATHYTAGVPIKKQRDVYVARLNPADDSWGYLGTGFHAQGVTVQDENTGQEVLGCDITADENGNVYVGTVERDDDGTFRYKPYVWRWDGASWTNLSLPPPSSIVGVWEVNGGNNFWDQLVMVIPYLRDGSQGGITVFYSYVNSDQSVPDQQGSITIEWTPGGGWAREVDTIWRNIEGFRANASIAAGSTNYQIRAVDPTVVWSAKLGKLVLMADFIAAIDEIWDMFVMNENNDQWELLEAIAPASSAGPWRQVRNSGAIGPDGDPWRAEMSDSLRLADEPHILKHSPGYGFGFVNGAKKAIGELATKERFISYFASAGYRLRWVGTTCYIMGNFSTQPFDDTDDEFAEGFFVFRGTYVPCVQIGPISLYRQHPIYLAG